jgi:hypothetical protein
LDVLSDAALRVEETITLVGAQVRRLEAEQRKLE